MNKEERIIMGILCFIVALNCFFNCIPMSGQNILNGTIFMNLANLYLKGNSNE